MQHKLKREGSTVFTRSAHETMVGFHSEMENCIAYGSGLDCFVRQPERERQTLILWNKSLCNLTKCGLHHFWKNTLKKENLEVRVVVNLQPFTYIHNDSVCPRYRLGFKSHDGQPSIPLNFSTVFMFSVGNTLRILSDNQTNRTKTYGYELQLVRVVVLHFGGLSSSKSWNRLRL